MKNERLDQQWYTLILDAKKTGLSLEEIRNFLHGKTTDGLKKISQ